MHGARIFNRWLLGEGQPDGSPQEDTPAWRGGRELCAPNDSATVITFAVYKFTWGKTLACLPLRQRKEDVRTLEERGSPEAAEGWLNSVN